MVSVTGFWHRVFGGIHLERMEQIVREVCADFECELVEFNGESDHVHLLVHFPPKVALSRLVNSLKGVSSRRLRTEFPRVGPPLLPGERAVVGFLLRRVGGRRSDQRPAAVHRAAEPPGLSRVDAGSPGAIRLSLPCSAGRSAPPPA
ncbi:hypothetical protein Ppa05_71290 [Planomonospora parontospora subsp. antibiotica]|nr:hypothetical protein Ppa05_71290 [Planomonospora parontospora subsp. antibiotica]